MLKSRLFFVILLSLCPAVSGLRGQGSEPGLADESSPATRVSVSGRQIFVNGYATRWRGCATSPLLPGFNRRESNHQR